MVIEILADGKRVRVDGVEYVRANGGATATETWLLLNRLCEEYGIERKDAAIAARSGRLDARLPAGKARGRRCTRSEFERWLNDDYMTRLEA